MIYQKRKRFILLQTIIFLFGLYLFYSVDLSKEYEFILFYSLFNAISYGWLFIQEMKYAPDFHPYQILALVSLQFIGLNGISLYNQISSGENVFFCSAKINDCIYLGLLFLSLQHLLLFAIFFIMEKKKAEEIPIKIADKLKASRIDYAQWAQYSYLGVWGIRGLSYFIPLESISSVLVNYTNFGHLLTLYFLVFAMIQKPKRTSYKVYHWIIVVIETTLVLNHGMKEDIIRSLVPYCLYIMIMYKAGYKKVNIKMISVISIIALFVVGFVFPYVSLTRSISIETKQAWEDISSDKVFDKYAEYMTNESFFDDEEERSIKYLINRAGSIGSNAWAVEHARSGNLEPRYFYYCASAIIPRILWKNKPKVVTGAMAYALVNGDPNWEKPKSSEVHETSISLGFIGSCYMSFGLIPSLLYIIFLSWFIWFVWDNCRKKITYNIIIIWCFMSLIMVLLKDFEGFQDCGINFLAFNTLYLIISKYLIKMESSKKAANEP